MDHLHLSQATYKDTKCWASCSSWTEVAGRKFDYVYIHPLLEGSGETRNLSRLTKADHLLHYYHTRRTLWNTLVCEYDLNISARTYIQTRTGVNQDPHLSFQTPPPPRTMKTWMISYKNGQEEVNWWRWINASQDDLQEEELEPVNPGTTKVLHYQFISNILNRGLITLFVTFRAK